MKKRVALVGIYHESNTFSSIATSWKSFADGHIFRQSAIIDRYQDAHHEIGGFLKGIKGREIELVPVYFADAIPSGVIQAEAFDRLLAELLTGLAGVMPVDAVYCVAHGAAVSAAIRDVDGHWIKQVRQMVGPDVPMVCTLDPHANLSEQMAASTDAMVAYATNPHLDQKQTGLKAAQLMNQLLLESACFKQELIQLPASLSIEQQETAEEPCLSLYRDIADLMPEEHVYSHSILLGFPYADVHEMGTSVLLVSQKNYDTCLLKEQIVQVFERYYSQFTGSRLSIGEVLANRDQYAKPVLLLDMGDNVGAGAKGNSAYLLHALEEAHCAKGCIVIYDPDLVRRCDSYDPGDRLEMTLEDGDHPAGKSYSVQLLEKKQGKFSEASPRHGGQTDYDMGRVALVLTEGGNYVMLMSLRVPPFSRQQLALFDLDLTGLDWIIAKGVNAPIAAYKDICPVYLKVHTPGESHADATQFSYQFRRKPMLPFEPIAADKRIETDESRYDRD